MISKNKRPIVFATDRGYVQPLSVALVSLYQNNPYPLTVYIIHGNIRSKDAKNLLSIANEYNQTIILKKVDPSFFNKPYYQKSIHLKISAYYRLLIPEFVEQNMDSALYLDSDIQVCKDISYLLNLDIADYAIAAVPEQMPNKQLIPLGFGDSIYFNSGVLIFNLSKWRKNKIHWEIMDIIKQHYPKLIYLDQDALNLFFKGNFLRIHPNYNLAAFRRCCGPESYVNFFDALNVKNISFENATILHFAGSIKPWCSMKNVPQDQHLHEEYLQSYRECMKKTAYKKILKDRVSPIKHARYLKSLIIKLLKSLFHLK